MFSRKSPYSYTQTDTKILSIALTIIVLNVVLYFGYYEPLKNKEKKKRLENPDERDGLYYFAKENNFLKVEEKNKQRFYEKEYAFAKIFF